MLSYFLLQLLLEYAVIVTTGYILCYLVAVYFLFCLHWIKKMKNKILKLDIKKMRKELFSKRIDNDINKAKVLYFKSYLRKKEGRLF